jgi:hypothetical protein
MQFGDRQRNTPLKLDQGPVVAYGSLIRTPHRIRRLSRTLRCKAASFVVTTMDIWLLDKSGGGGGLQFNLQRLRHPVRNVTILIGQIPDLYLSY